MRLGISTGQKKFIEVVWGAFVLTLFFFLSLPASAAVTDNSSVQNSNQGSLVIAVVIIIAGIATGFLLYRYTKTRGRLTAKEEELKEANRELSELRNKIAGEHNIITHDLTATERFHSKLIEAANDGISFYDRNNKLILANDAFYSVLGYTKDEMSRYTAVELLHPDYANFESENAENLKRDGISQVEIMLQHKEGHYVYLSAKSVLVRDEKDVPMGFLMISRDITEQKRAEQELRTAKEMAEASNRIKSSFLANISHEVRTPLNSVVGFSNLLMMDDVSDEQKAEYVDLINANSEKLLQVIGDIIDLSRLESSQLEISYDETSIGAIVAEAISEAKCNILRSEKPITLTLMNQMGDASDLIFTDKTWLKRILRHLLDNAVKFTLEGEITLTYFYDNKELVFSIRDTGIGINKANIERIFEEFNQEVTGHHRPFEGLGLGLSLAKQVLDRMGGRINVYSEKGVGSVFTFTIPYRQAGVSKPAGKADIRQNRLTWNKIKCLIIDDNKDVLIYITRILVDSGIQIVTTSSGEEAIRLMKNDPGINMVLLDMQIPGMKGADLAAEIRKVKRNIPIIAQTAFVFEEGNNEALKAGCDACLVKPIRRDNLISVISSFTITA
ncbi:MAG TPA: ATP-binding protein [Bacteroidales bacterium]|mgnify:CR=1 FL=1|nr:ATP-binding protein [Bacteroidales bacterium]HPT12458.1 ATP-binding protein [Bacteroidales bacterium]